MRFISIFRIPNNYSTGLSRSHLPLLALTVEYLSSKYINYSKNPITDPLRITMFLFFEKSPSVHFNNSTLILMCTSLTRFLAA